MTPCVSLACHPSLRYAGSIVRPGVPVSTTKVEIPSSVRAVRLVRESAGGVVEDAATHRECLGEDGFREPRSFESVDATDGQGQVDGASCVEVGSSRVRAALIEGDLVSAPGKEDGEQGAGQPGADDRDP